MSGPFRRDPRVERYAACAPAEVALPLVAKRAAGVSAFALYLTALGLGALASSLALPRTSLSGVFTGALLIAAAALLLWVVARSRARSAARASSLPSRCAFTADRMILEGEGAHTAWRYEAVRALTREGSWLLVELDRGLLLLLRADEPADDPLEDFLARRVPPRAPRPSRAALPLLALAYFALASLGVFVVR